jgi:predicted ATPase
MKIDYLKINSRFKNLDHIEVNLDENHLMTVVVGWNGAGKSNLLEALVAIFRDLDLGESPRFAYEIKYRLGDDSSGDAASSLWVRVRADPTLGNSPASQYQIQTSRADQKDLLGENVWLNAPLSRVTRDKQGRSDYLPRHLFAYYSGPSDRLESYFKKHRTDFYRRLLRNELQLEGEIRPLFYAKPIHSQFVLLAFFLGESNSQELEFLNEYLGIESLDAVHFVLRRPGWAKSAKRNELFWGASGVVREFLDRLLPHALAPIKVTRNEDVSLTGSSVTNEFFHLFLPDLEAMRAVAGSLSPDVFFKMLESMLLSEILAEVRVRVKVRYSDGALSFRELSEGEQQLLTVLGLLKFTGGKDSLFLLDEPDTHLNPAWTVKYLGFLRKFVPIQATSHVLMVTHDPLALAELEKGQVQIMWRDSDGIVHADIPEIDPRGMGYAGILTSDMFGLGSTLDEYTTNLLRKRRAILEKEIVNDADSAELDKLNRELDGMGFSTAHWDEDYREYLQIRKKVYPEVFHPTTEDTPEAKKVRREKAQEIIRQILEEEADRKQEGNQ